MTFQVEPYDDDEVKPSVDPLDLEDNYDPYDEFSDCDCDVCNPDFEEEEPPDYDTVN